MSGIELGGVHFDSLRPHETVATDWRLMINGRRRIVDVNILTCQAMLRRWLLRGRFPLTMEPVSASEFAAGIRFLKSQHDETIKGAIDVQQQA